MGLALFVAHHGGDLQVAELVHNWILPGVQCFAMRLTASGSVREVTGGTEGAALP